MGTFTPAFHPFLGWSGDARPRDHAAGRPGRMSTPDDSLSLALLTPHTPPYPGPRKLHRLPSKTEEAQRCWITKLCRCS